MLRLLFTSLLSLRLLLLLLLLLNVCSLSLFLSLDLLCRFINVTHQLIHSKLNDLFAVCCVANYLIGMSCKTIPVNINIIFVVRRGLFSRLLGRWWWLRLILLIDILCGNLPSNYLSLNGSVLEQLTIGSLKCFSWAFKATTASHAAAAQAHYEGYTYSEEDGNKPVQIQLKVFEQLIKHIELLIVEADVPKLQLAVLVYVVVQVEHLV